MRRYELIDEEGSAHDFMRGFFAPYLVQQARALVQSQCRADIQGFQHRDDNIAHFVNWKVVKEVVEDSLSEDPLYWELYTESNQHDVTYAWQGNKYTVSVLQGDFPGEFKPPFRFLITHELPFFQ